MENRQRLMEIAKIFNESIKIEVSNYFKSGENQPDSEKSKITFFNVKGDMIFLDKYCLAGDGDGGNEIMKAINDENPADVASTFIIPDNSSDEMNNFFLHLCSNSYLSYFIKENHNEKTIFRLDADKMLDNKEFQKIILQMFEDIAPEHLEEVEQLLVS